MRKLYYIPGMFSIILLPILGIWYMNKHDYFIELGSFDFNYIDFEQLQKWKEEYEFVSFSNEFDKRIYKEVTLNGNKDDSRNTFKYIDQFVNNVVQTKDTINGLKIHFGENSIYNEFIQVLNIFNKREAESYILDHNTMYFVGRDWFPKTEKVSDMPIIECGTVWIDDTEEKEQKFNFKKELNNFKMHFLQNKIIYSANIFLIAIALISLRNLKRR